ncbi:hypothetical protein [Arenimonas malthae]|uniref:hypothetical protein n=1 Tax=Arenimonas malthae TaxID=354197 RepID=UPI0012EBE0FB|nr:hypothetical protein [Arenimonas malthae]
MFPDNFHRLRWQEQAIQAEAVKAIESSPDHGLHIGMVERSLDLLNVLVGKAPAKNDDDLTIQLLGIRVTNDLLGCLRLALGGYCQPGVMLLRDAFETTLLVDYFHLRPERIAEWRSFTSNDPSASNGESRKALRQEFKAVSIREALDNRDADGSLRRMKRYKMLSSLGAHPTFAGIALTRDENGLAQWGPFFREALLFAVIEELVWVAMEGAFVLGRHFELEEIPQIAVDVGFYETMSRWNEHFFDVPHQADRFEELRELLHKA